MVILAFLLSGKLIAEDDATKSRIRNRGKKKRRGAAEDRESFVMST